MKNTLFIAFLMLTTFSFSQEKNKFEKFKTGTFTYQSGKTTIVVKRTESKQFEYFDGGKIVMNVEWTSDSTFVLTAKKIGGKPGCLSKGDWIKVKIVKVNGNKYTAKYYSEFCGFGETVFTKIEEEL